MKEATPRTTTEIIVRAIALTLMVMTLLFTANTAEAGRKLVKVDGSSTVFPITEAVAEEFQIEKRGRIMVTVGVSGTGGGFKKFCRGEVDIADASREIKTKEAELCKKNGIEFIELSVAFDGLAVIVNPKNDWVDYLTIEELRKIWSPEAKGRVMKWSDVREGFPDKPLTLFGPGTDSGTFDYFTHTINGKSGASRTDFTASEDDNVLVQGVSTDSGSLGYFGIAYYAYNKDKLKLIAIDDEIETNGKGAILPSNTTVSDGTYSPLSRPIFIYVSKTSFEKEEVKDFVNFYMDNTNMLSEEVGYIALDEETLKLNKAKLPK
ncbi:MAG: PstS family phosphate ABC transporter substrate-binding protein [Deltaproteobacteria bacterium]|nr:PstS family phosphate ABC transporter substrate-binding protein [Deltaproteobacteria bacterium]